MMSDTVTIETIKRDMDALAVMLADKGFALPEARISISSGDAHEGRLWLLAKGEKYQHINEVLYSAKCDTYDAQLADVRAWIDAQPDANKRHLHEFMGALGKLIDKGRDLGIPVDFVNPLTDTMKRLSENVITDQRAKDNG